MKVALMSDITLRRGDRFDAEGIRTLIAHVFPENARKDAAVLSWLYWENPFGDALVWVCESNGLIVCNHARLPVPVMIRGRRERGAISVDAATAPEMRGRGLHGRCRDASNADTCDQGLHVSFNFRGRESMLPRADAPSVGPIDHFLLPVDAIWIARRLKLPRVIGAALLRSKTRRVSACEAAEVEKVPADVGGLWSELEPKVPFGIAKDELWWRWRYESHPYKPYRYFAVRERGTLIGLAAAVGRRVDDAEFAYITDLLAISDTAASALVREIGAAFPSIAAVSWRARRGTYSAKLARSAGLFRVPRRLEPNPLTLHVRDVCGDRPELLEHPWSVGWGDSDHL